MLNANITNVCNLIKQEFSPNKIIMYNQKTSLVGEVTSFKLCLVFSAEIAKKVEVEIYSSIDCEIPFDILIYTTEEWEKFSNQKDSFAEKINRTGVVIYG